MYQAILEELDQYSSKELEEKCKYFHKTNKGGYAEKDLFLGITVPKIRLVAKKYYMKISLGEVSKILCSPYHEYRLAALIILTYKMKKANEEEQKQIVNLYLNHTKYINGWDLVDLSAHYILGAYLLDKTDRSILYQLANLNHLWEQRISIISTWIFIRNNEFQDTLKIAEILLHHEHDLIHKAVGWMLREVGKKNYEIEYNFLLQSYREMPRTMLRYAIEKFPEETRKKFLRGEI